MSHHSRLLTLSLSLILLAACGGGGAESQAAATAAAAAATSAAAAATIAAGASTPAPAPQATPPAGQPTSAPPTAINPLPTQPAQTAPPQATPVTMATIIAAGGAVYYVRPDGGSGEQCTGRADAPYPGSGTGQPCAWDHPFRALPPGGTPRIAGGDTLVVAAGAYRMGFGAPGADTCNEAGSYDCVMPPIPSGPDANHPTRILGAGWDSGCSSPPELWGTGRPWFIVNLTDSSNVELSCFEITDHSPCVENHTGGLACERNNPPYGDWAAYGLHAEDSTNAHLRDLNIHGLAAGGIHAGRLSNWTVENVRLAGNGSVGWDGDLWDDDGDANSGTLRFRNWLVEWNGCGETYPGSEPTGCWAQEAGGYGDGVGTGETGGNWIIEDSAFLHNTSDGLDLLYHTLGGSITLDRVRAEGNAGNQIKVSGQSEITNSVLVGNCAFFENQPFTYRVDQCRALGNTLAGFFTGGDTISILNSTLYGQGDGLVMPGIREGFRCRGTEKFVARNSIFIGDKDYFDPSDITFLFYDEQCPPLKLDSDYNIISNAKNIVCNQTSDYVVSGAHDSCVDPRLTGPLSGMAFGMVPAPGSPAIDAGDNGVCPPVDILGAPRPVDGNADGSAVCDIGAYEFGAPGGVVAPPPVPSVPTQVLQATLPPSAPPPQQSGAFHWVAMGDSLTEGDGKSDIPRRYTELVLARLQTIRPEATLRNVGRSGWTLEQMVADQVPVALRDDPALVSIWIGANDVIYFNPGEDVTANATAFEQRLDAAVSQILARTRARVLIANLHDISLIPAARGWSPAERAARHDMTIALNQAIANVVQRHTDRVALVDMFNLAALREMSCYADDYHPSDDCEPRIAELWWQTMQGVLR